MSAIEEVILKAVGKHSSLLVWFGYARLVVVQIHDGLDPRGAALALQTTPLRITHHTSQRRHNMIIPMRCFSCGKVIADLWDDYLKALQDGVKEAYYPPIPLGSRIFKLLTGTETQWTNLAVSVTAVGEC